MSITVDIEKKLGSFHLHAQFSAEDEVLALLGASGCGKSVTLRCIAGIEKPDKGHIIVDGVTLFDSERHINLSAQERRTGLLFQNYALFPNMTVLQNISVGAKREKNKALREARIRAVMEGFELTALAAQFPSQLSGGQQQRTALARILVSEPRILLLDEPFSALDSHLRFQVERQVEQVIRTFGKTVVLVSHDRDEVYRLADRVAVMGSGRIETVGEIKTVFAAPQTRNAAALTGCKNISRAERLNQTQVFAKDWGVTLQTKPLPETTAFVGIRMHDLCSATEKDENFFRCTVVQEIENPFSFLVFLRPVGLRDTAPLAWELPKEEWNRLRADEVGISVPVRALMPLSE